MKVVVYGAGSVGCYLGAILHRMGVNTHLLGRARVKLNIENAGGITLTDYHQRKEHITIVPFTCRPEVLNDAEVVLLTLKSTAMETAIEDLRTFCPDSALIVCLQNGVGSTEKVAMALSEHQVLQGIVSFNVVQNGAHFHRATEGQLHLPVHVLSGPLQSAFQAFGLGCELNSNIDELVWGKLLLNLNNAINALSDLPLKEQLSQRDYRLVLARCQRELLQVCEHQNITPAKLTAVPPRWLPVVLSLPDWIFSIVAQKMLAIDAQARSSMWDDLQQRRSTEIEVLNGAVVRLAEASGLSAPANKMVYDWIISVQDGHVRNAVSGEQLLTMLNERNQ